MDHEINHEGALEFAHQFIASAYYMPGTNPANLARAYIELTGKADALRARVATLEADNARLREAVERIKKTWACYDCANGSGHDLDAAIIAAEAALKGGK